MKRERMRGFGKAVGLYRSTSMRVVTTDEFRMFPANGKQQTVELNCTAKFPRVELSSVGPLPLCRIPIVSRFPLCLRSPLQSRSDHTVVQRGGCGVAYVCKSYVGGCGTLQSCEYACTRAYDATRADNTYVCVTLRVQSVCRIVVRDDHWEIRRCNLSSRCAL